MANIPNTRRGNTVVAHIKLKDGGLLIPWSNFSGIRVDAYSVEQRMLAAQCEAVVNQDDDTILDVTYSGDSMQYLGLCKIIVRGTYDSRKKTYDAPLVNFVADTAQATGVIVVTDPEVNVLIDVQEVSTSVLDEAIAAAIAAAEHAEETATKSPYIDDTTGNWMVYNPTTGEYVDSEIPATGPQGPQGVSPMEFGTGENSAYLDGSGSVASGQNSVAVGTNTRASGKGSHSEGNDTVASGDNSHAEGFHTNATGDNSHAEGRYTQAQNTGEHAEGHYNVSIPVKTRHTVGIGTANNFRKNAHTITNDGKHYIPGIGGYEGTENTAEALAARQDLASVIATFVTRSVNDLANYYLKSETYTKTEVDAIVAALYQFHFEVYASLEAITSPSSNVLYLIGPTGSGADKYEEYVYSNSTFVKIGDTSIDLSGYVTTTALNTALATKVNVSDIVDNLTTNDATKPLSAKQGKVLNDTKVGYSDIVDNLTTNDATKPLSAKQGKVLGEQVSQLGQNIRIPISGWGTNWNGQITEAGQYGYNPSTKLLKKCIDFRTTAETSIYETIPFNEFTLYVYNGRIYVWDGTQLIDRTTNLSPAEITKWINSYGILSDFDSIIGKGISVTDGSLISAAECSCTDYIDVSKYSTLFYARLNSDTVSEYTTLGVAFYDSGKQFISGIPGKGRMSPGYNGEILNVPSNVKYARFTYWTEDDATYGVEALKQSFYIVVNHEAGLNGKIETLEGINDFFQLVSQFNDSRIAYTYEAGRAIRYSDGVLINVSECCATGLVDVSSERAVVLNYLCATSSGTVVGIAFYDSDENYISGKKSKVHTSIGYERTVFEIPENAKYLRCTFWNSNYSGMSQFKDKFYISGYAVAQMYLNNLPENIIHIPTTTWIGTTRNYILKLESGNLMHSDDLGKTWKTLENTIGDIMFVHWFANGTCLICGEEKAFTTKDFTTLVESTIYDYDGSPFAGGSHNFFHEFSYNNPYNLIDGKETVVWTDYDNSQGYISRLWMSDDNGRTIRCILKNGESIVDGEILSITHFHHCVWDKYAQCLWVSTGDYNNGNKLIRGTIQNGVWTFTTIAQGNNFKYGMIMYDETYLYLITDITHGDAPRGLVKVNKDSINDVSSYSYIYKNPDNISFISYYENNGIKVLFPDGAAANRGKVYIADGDVNFKEYDFVCGDNNSRILGQSVGPNYNGDLIAITYAGYGSGYKLNMSRYLLSVGMANAGFKDFNKTKLV